MIRFYVGGYASPGETGIRECALDARTARCECISELSGLTNPSYIICHPRGRMLYAVEESAPEGGIAALAIGERGLRKVCELPSLGADPCHLSLSPDSRFLFVSNYLSGSLTVFRLSAEGIPEGVSDRVQHEMDARTDGIPSRQERAHVHFSTCDGERVFVCDLGANAVYVYEWDAANGKLVKCNARIPFPRASGPRHLALSGGSRFLYVLCELSARVHAFARSGEDGWRRIQDVSTVPEDFRDFPAFDYSVGAAIRLVDGRTLCASSRGHNSIALFQIAPDGRLCNRRVIPSGGDTPRDFQALGNCLVVANQGSGSISVFGRDGAEGYSLRSQISNIGRPSCICAAPEG